MIRLSDIKTAVSEPESVLYEKAARKLGIRPEDITDLRILKRSLDARRKPELFYVYTIALD